MWSNRWVRVGAVALGIFVINGVARLISLAPDEGSSALTVIAVVGMLAVVALLGVAGAVWSVRHPLGRVIADLGFAIIGGALLALLIGPLLVGTNPFTDGPESFVLQFLQFVGLGALGMLVGVAVMVVLGKDWRSRGLAAYVDRYGRRSQPHAPSTRKR